MRVDVCVCFCAREKFVTFFFCFSFGMCTHAFFMFIFENPAHALTRIHVYTRACVCHGEGFKCQVFDCEQVPLLYKCQVFDCEQALLIGYSNPE